MIRYRSIRRWCLSLGSACGLGFCLLGSAGPVFSQPVLSPSVHDPAPTHRAIESPQAAPGPLVQLTHQPVHLWQWNPAPDAYSPMGCGAFTTAMALSTYAPQRFGSYPVARGFLAQMPQIPLIGGTFEAANATMARQAGFAATTFDDGTSADLMTAIDAGAPVILLVDPLFLGLGRHDVLLVGYRLNAAGTLQDVFVDNPAIQDAGGADPNAPAAPGNQLITLADLQHIWTGVFTPVFRTPAAEQSWRQVAGR